jgi:hypothetical protein
MSPPFRTAHSQEQSRDISKRKDFCSASRRGSIYIEFSFLYGKKRDVNKSPLYCAQYDSKVGTANS